MARSAMETGGLCTISLSRFATVLFIDSERFTICSARLAAIDMRGILE
jgi:hypothetical protein